MIFHRLALGGALALLAACGSKGDLQARSVEALPPAPYGAERRPTPAEMLVPPPQAVPERVDDPVKHSEERREDRFELPPQR